MRRRQAAVERIRTAQRELVGQASNPENKWNIVRNIIGPAGLYDTLPSDETVDRVFPWCDGRWSDGITVSDDGCTVTFCLKPPGAADNDNNNDDGDVKGKQRLEPPKCVFQDMLGFVYFVLQYQSVKKGAFPEMMEALRHVEAALLQFICGTTRQIIRDCV